MTIQEEEFIHFISCISWLDNASWILDEIQTSSPNPLIHPAFRFALIEYSKPYKNSFGFQKKHILDTSYIPVEFLLLHERIVNSRDQIQAHTDLTVLSAQVYIYESQGRQRAGLVQNGISGVEELSNLDQILAMIRATLDNMYGKVKLLEAALPA